MVIGLTGGICSGKTTASEALRAASAWVIDCDLVAHHLATNDVDIITAVRDAFGREVMMPHGGIDRRRLAKAVFTEAGLRLKLEAILHPPILALVRRAVQYARDNKWHLVVVVPLLFELSMQSEFDETWLVTCQPETQLSRLMARSGLGRADAEAWINAQMPQTEKEKLASRVFSNDAKIDDLQAAVRRAWEGIART